LILHLPRVVRTLPSRQVANSNGSRNISETAADRKRISPNELLHLLPPEQRDAVAERRSRRRTCRTGPDPRSSAAVIGPAAAGGAALALLSPSWSACLLLQAPQPHVM
jgi:hypothetical protein